MAKLGHVFWPVLGRPSGRARACTMHVPRPMSWRAALAINARAYVLARTLGHSEYTPCWGSMLGLTSWHAGLATLIPM
eukprot:4577037-Lingulodinium_polyedra.AAC.1